jgi:hypothetical protein
MLANRTIIIDGYTYVEISDGRLGVACSRCGGSGFWAHSHRAPSGGVCYQCGGAGYGSVLSDRASAAKHAAKRRAERERRAEKKNLAQQAGERVRDLRVNRFASEHSELYAWMYLERENSVFIESLWNQLHRPKEWEFSEKQLSALQSAFAASGERAEKKAIEAIESRWSSTPIGEKVTIEGIVTFTRVVPGDYGNSNMLVLVDEQGIEYKMFTSAQWSNEVEKDDKLSVIATVKKLDSYNGKKSTLVNRPRLITWAQAQRTGD